MMLRRNPSSNSIGLSSNESDDATMSDCSKINLHLIADPGCGRKVHTAYQSLLTLLDKDLSIIFASERNIPVGDKYSKNAEEDFLPTLAVLLFFNNQRDDANNNETIIPQITLTTPKSSRHIPLPDHRNKQPGHHPLFGNKDPRKYDDKPPDALERLGIFIIEDDESVIMSGNEGDKLECPHSPLDDARYQIRRNPWTFHHEETPQSRISLCPENKQEYHTYLRKQGSDEFDYPLIGVRQMHYGRQILRFTLFVESDNWEEQIDFYKLILGKNVVMAKEDFHYFVIWSTATTDVEFALKRINYKQSRVCLRRTVLEFSVQNLPMFVPLLPHNCNQISKERWQTKDYEGNLILFHAQANFNAPVASSVLDLFTNIKKPTGDNNDHEYIYNYQTLPNPRKFGTVKKNYCVYYSDTEDVLKHKSALERSDSFEEPALPERMPLLSPSSYTDLSRKFPLRWGQTSTSLPDTPTHSVTSDICAQSTQSEHCRHNSNISTPSSKDVFIFKAPSFSRTSANRSPIHNRHENAAKKYSVPKQQQQHNESENHVKDKPENNTTTKTNETTKVVFKNHTPPINENNNFIDDKVSNVIMVNTIEVDDVEIYV